MLFKICVFGVVASLVNTEQGREYWQKIARENVNRYLRQKPNTQIARNIVLMIGDGLGQSTVTAARTMKGQLEGKSAEEAELVFEKFPYTALSKVYTTDYQVPDSAATMTAMLSGVKTNSRTLGVDSLATYDSCHDLRDHRLPNMLQWTQAAGKATGFVTTARVTHATPAALYATTTNRDWESDHDVPYTPEGYCSDIASQLVYNGSDIKVILGGGSRSFIPNTMPDPTTGIIDFKNQRLDGKNLVQAWKEDKVQRNATHKVVYNAGQLSSVDPDSTDFLFGLFNKSHMSYEIERDTSQTGEPSLAEMTRKAIQILEKNEKGFFLMVEGARIDHGHHAVQAKHALTDTIAFEEAVQTVLNMTNETETLVIVTADHSHTMTISGYPEKGNNILDLVRTDTEGLLLAEDDMPYTTLMYANGPNKNGRTNLTGVDTTKSGFKQDVVVEMRSETHSGEEVTVYAQGPMAHLLTGVKEQNVIAYVMAHAACVGNIGIPCETGREIHEDNNDECEKQTSDSAMLLVPIYLLVACSALPFSRILA